MKKSVTKPHTKEPMAACQCKSESGYELGPPESERKVQLLYLWRSVVIMSRSSLLILMREVFTLLFHSLQQRMFIYVIKYLMVKPHCLSPLPHCLCSLVYNTNWSSPSFTQMSERKMWKCPSLVLLLPSPQIPISHAFFLSPSLTYSSCLLLKTHTINQGH